MASNRLRGLLLALTAAGALASCAARSGETASAPEPAAAPARASVADAEDPYPSTYRAYPGVPTAITGATIFDGEGGRIENGTVVLVNGRIQAVGGADTPIPEGATRIDGRGRWVTPGVIDVHSHLGDYPSPNVDGNSDGNEITSPVRPEVWAEHSVWPQDPGFSRALANGGITTLQILPGSANLFGGRGVTVRNVPGRTVQSMSDPARGAHGAGLGDPHELERDV
ncbi:MAG TPA: hypothetical protein VLK25_02860, partial [Allosphingosinicella sp.]|nr:hypothetical protein [Allosphingosinicella sp.]